MLRHLFILCIIFFVISPVARADNIPQHLAGMASTLYRDAEKKLQNFQSPNPEEMQAVTSTLETFKEMHVKVYSRKPIDISEPFISLEESLGFESGDKNSRTFIQDLWSLPEEDAADKIRDHLKIPDDEVTNAIDEILAELNQVKSGGGLDTEFTSEFSDGRTVTTTWQPATGETSVTVASDGSGDLPEFSTTLDGTVDLEFDEKGEPTLVTKPQEDFEPKVATAEELAARRASIIGEWQTEGGYLITVSAASEDDGEVARSPDEIKADIETLQKKRKRLKDDKIYVWRNAKTGKEERQEKFRQLKEPWNYEGEKPLTDNLEEKLANIDKEIADLQAELKVDLPPAMRMDPIGFKQVKADPRARALHISFQFEEGCILEYEDAWFDGRRLAARRTHDSTCAMNDSLPAPIQNKLITQGWNPPQWLLSEVAAEDNNQLLKLKLTEYGLRVRYSPGDYSISEIFDPYASDRDIAFRGEKTNQRYSVASNALP